MKITQNALMSRFSDFNSFLTNPLVSNNITNMDFDDYVYQLLMHYVNNEVSY
jgi:hypothetical protein